MTECDELQQLHAELKALHRAVDREAMALMHRFSGCCFVAGRDLRSAGNLAHYLAFRRRDLRTLQDRLAATGLSSLGRCESHVAASLERVIRLLALATGLEASEAEPVGHQCPTVTFEEGRERLEQNAEALFGAAREGRTTRIMVTLPTEAAYDHSLLRDLLLSGTDAVRINCAHDDAETWKRMIDNLRAVEQELQLPGRCRIQMDLAGHKLRTGPAEVAPAVIHLRPRRDRFGRPVEPASVVLLASHDDAAEPADGRASQPLLPLPREMVEGLQVGDRLSLIDTRGKTRVIDVVGELPSGHWLGECRDSAWLLPGMPLRWRRLEADGTYHEITGAWRIESFAGRDETIRVQRGDPLLLTRHQEPGRPARRDEDGQIVEPARIACTLPAVLDQLTEGAAVWIDDGRIGAVVETSTHDGLLLRVTHARPKGEPVKPDKGLNFPDTEIDLPALTEKDLHDLDFVARYADMVGFSFVQTLEDMDTMIRELQARNADHLVVVAKIETARAVRNLPDLLLGAIGRQPLALMIARGDLAVELGSVRLAEIQEEILWLSEAAHVPVIWATQVLETLAKNGVATRPEVTDAAMSGRADCVMLNKGPFIVRAVEVLDEILRRMLGHQRKKGARLRALSLAGSADEPG